MKIYKDYYKNVINTTYFLCKVLTDKHIHDSIGTSFWENKKQKTEYNNNNINKLIWLSPQ